MMLNGYIQEPLLLQAYQLTKLVVHAEASFITVKQLLADPKYQTGNQRRLQLPQHGKIPLEMSPTTNSANLKPFSYSCCWCQ